MRLSDTLGLKFPDENIVRFFFKEVLPSRTGSVLELGCSNGNNLAVFCEYGFSVTGVDIGEAVIHQAQHNFFLLYGQDSEPRYKFVHEDMQSYLDRDQGSYDVVLLPSSLYYLPEPGIESVLKRVRRNMKSGSLFFLRMRTPADYRFGKGIPLSERSWQLTTSVTGELNCVVTFYREAEFAKLLSSLWSPVRTTWCKCRFENPQNGVMVANDDFVVWGEV